MRLTDIERNLILKTIRSWDPDSKIFLYGSRLDDQLKGGDIDLLVLSQTLSFSDKISILTELKDQLGEQKIDLLLAKDRKSEFVKAVFESAEMLKDTTKS